MSTEAETVAQTHPFQAEVAELLRLMVHSVYSETDIFLREPPSRTPQETCHAALSC